MCIRTSKSFQGLFHFHDMSTRYKRVSHKHTIQRNMKFVSKAIKSGKFYFSLRYDIMRCDATQRNECLGRDWHWESAIRAFTSRQSVLESGFQTELDDKIFSRISYHRLHSLSLYNYVVGNREESSLVVTTCPWKWSGTVGVMFFFFSFSISLFIFLEKINIQRKYGEIFK